jgi:plastocyanin
MPPALRWHRHSRLCKPQQPPASKPKHAGFGTAVLLLSVIAATLSVGTPTARPQQPPPAPITVRVDIIRREPTKPSTAHDFSNVVVWLTPVNEAGAPVAATRTIPPRQNLQLVQRNKSFQPHVLVVPAGSVVEFPNKDPFFHNVFSLFDGKRFDLGLYEGGSSMSARFEHPGVSFLFCNIHPDMSAAVVSVDTPYYALSDRSGLVTISNVPDGRYLLHVWYERSSVDELKNFERVIVISAATRSLETLRIPDNGDFKLTHKNKYNQDYTPIPNSAYKRP